MKKKKKIHRWRRMPNQRLHMPDIYLGSQQQFKSSHLLYKTSGIITNFSHQILSTTSFSTTSFFLPLISHCFPPSAFSRCTDIHSGSLWSILYHGTKNFSYSYLFFFFFFGCFTQRNKLCWSALKMHHFQWTIILSWEIFCLTLLREEILGGSQCGGTTVDPFLCGSLFGIRLPKGNWLSPVCFSLGILYIRTACSNHVPYFLSLSFPLVLLHVELFHALAPLLLVSLFCVLHATWPLYLLFCSFQFPAH